MYLFFYWSCLIHDPRFYTKVFWQVFRRLLNIVQRIKVVAQSSPQGRMGSIKKITNAVKTFVKIKHRVNNTLCIAWNFLMNLITVWFLRKQNKSRILFRTCGIFYLISFTGNANNIKCQETSFNYISMHIDLSCLLLYAIWISFSQL